MRAMLLILFAGLITISSTVPADFDSERDLVALHYEHSSERDVAVSAAAGLTVVRAMALQVHVVGSAQDNAGDDQYRADSSVAMNAIWGTGWYDASVNRELALASSVTRWSQVLLAGADVWVAEGGRSDFTAGVLRRIKDELPAIDTRSRIHVVQHSEWNEVSANQPTLRYVSNNTDYIQIDDGNVLNATADLSQKSDRFVDAALAGSQAAAWQAAFRQQNPNYGLDFSDTVELLYIVGVGTDQVRSPDEFAARFFTFRGEDTQPPSFPLYWTDSYSVDGQCFCDTDFDHGLDSTYITTPAGELSVIQICADILDQFGGGRSSGRVYYNTIQCGHGPVNTAADEIDCPGFLTDLSGAIQNYNCSAQGALWNLDVLYDNQSDNGESDFNDNDNGQSDFDAGDSEQSEFDNSVQIVDVVDDNEGSNADSASGDDDFPDPAPEPLSCLLAGSDSDGDGYGFENGRTCLAPVSVAEEVIDNQGSPSDGPNSDTTSDSGLVFCQSADSDSDGDGFGWENDNTCAVQISSTDDVVNNPGGSVNDQVVLGGRGSIDWWVGCLILLAGVQARKHRLCTRRS